MNRFIILFVFVVISLGFCKIVYAEDVYRLDDIEYKLLAVVKKVVSALGKENEERELKYFLKEYDAVIEDVGKIINSAGLDLTIQRPELKERIVRETQGFSVTTITEPSIFLYGSIKKEEVMRSWRDQLEVNLKQIEILLKNNSNEIIRHQWVWYEDYRKDRREFFCAIQLRDCLKESHKLAKLIISKYKLVRISKNQMLFEEKFNHDLSRWQKHGEAQTEIKDGGLYVKGFPFMLWTAGKFFEGGCIVSIEFIPGQGNGGVIFAFPGSPKKGLDYLVSAGRYAPRDHLPPGNNDIMEPYNWGINTYHVSVHRNRTHLRRTGHGLKMLNVLFKDPCSEKNQKYHIELLQFGHSFQVLVDGKLIHYYYDAGVYGPVLTHGHLGIKQFGKINATYDNIRIFKLKIVGG